MNIFRSLLGKVWQDPNAAEVVKISTGQLYLFRPGNIRTSRECIYNEAMATIRRVPSVEHNFQLVITRVYEDGDQELLEDEDETDEERVFLIAEELEFRTDQTDGNPTLVWRDLEGDVDEFYEFQAPGTNAPTLAFFETCMYRAIYERKYKKSADNVQDSELEQFIWKRPAKKSKSRNASSSEKDVAGASLAMRTVAVEGASSLEKAKSSAKSKANPASQSAPSPTLSPVRTSTSSLPSLFAEPAELFLWEIKEEEFVKQGDVVAKIVQLSGGQFDYWLTASNEEGQLLAHRVTTEMNQRYSARLQSFTWNDISDNGLQSSWALRFNEPQAYEAFTELFTKVLWEHLHQREWGVMKEPEQQYVIRSNSEDIIMGEPDDEEDEEAVLSELEETSESEEEEEEEEDEENAPPRLAKGERNSQLTVGYKGDRSYVVRGSNIGVFRHAGDNHTEYHATISNIITPKGKEIRPKQVMLHDQDTKMILMNPTDSRSLFSMDIERGKVVEEWKVHDDIDVDHIAPQAKFAQTTREQTLVGVSHNALFRIDPRMSGNKLVESQFKQYVSKNKFSGVTTTEAGKLAVASEKGEIRLFDSVGKNAKTALPPLGDPILGIDVTADGRYIVATTKTYLLLIDTLIGEGRYAGSFGFDRSFPATAKPIPRRLQLRGEHVAYMNHNVNFTPARFNQGEGQVENAIVTSTGQYVVAWDFAKVKKGVLDKYEIKKYEDIVVQDNFKFGDDKEIIVALQNNVLAINKKQLKRPTRSSLGTPRSSLRSKSNIVNSPY